MKPLSPELNFRPVQDHDLAFLAALYRSTRDDLLALPMASEFVDQLILSQQKIHQAGVQQTYPNAQTLIAEVAGHPVAQMIFVHNPTFDGANLEPEAGQEMRLIDIAVMPAAQRRGYARQMLNHLQQLARTRHAALRLRVLKTSIKPRQLYLSAGFQITEDDAMTEQMCWRAEAT